MEDNPKIFVVSPDFHPETVGGEGERTYLDFSIHMFQRQVGKNTTYSSVSGVRIAHVKDPKKSLGIAGWWFQGV